MRHGELIENRDWKMGGEVGARRLGRWAFFFGARIAGWDETALAGDRKPQEPTLRKRRVGHPNRRPTLNVQG